ncbi:MAG: hypothetical protein DUD31_11575 [Coriobacteriaceae bacterium]|nr:MAG: hypothetical protein DUD31_11575 [Coriobacteriaceae bacterium]
MEADDFYIGTRAQGARGRGTEQQPMLAAVDRAPAGRGSCAIRCAQDCSGGSWRQFGHDHLCHASRIRADAWSGIAAGLSSFRGLEQKEYDSSDGDASLPSDACMELLHEMCLMHVPLSGIAATATVQPKLPASLPKPFTVRGA